jgi:hypothetical protein
MWLSGSRSKSRPRHQRPERDTGGDGTMEGKRAEAKVSSGLIFKWACAEMV